MLLLVGAERVTRIAPALPLSVKRLGPFRRPVGNNGGTTILRGDYKDLARLRCVRLVRDLGETVAQQVELQLHGFERRFHGSLPVALEAPCTTQASDDVLWGTPGEVIPRRVPPSCSAPCTETSMLRSNPRNRLSNPRNLQFTLFARRPARLPGTARMTPAAKPVDAHADRFQMFDNRLRSCSSTCWTATPGRDGVSTRTARRLTLARMPRNDSRAQFGPHSGGRNFTRCVHGDASFHTRSGRTRQHFAGEHSLTNRCSLHASDSCSSSPRCCSERRGWAMATASTERSSSRPERC